MLGDADGEMYFFNALRPIIQGFQNLLDCYSDIIRIP